jgi:hypothetical protein
MNAVAVMAPSGEAVERGVLGNETLTEAFESIAAQMLPKITLDVNPEKAGQDLARIVLALVEFLRRLLELQAIRRMEAGRLSEAEEERVGTALMQSAEAIRIVAAQFGLQEKDLNLDLGPLGRLI